MTSQSGGGNSYPGVTSDNAQGLVVAGSLEAGTVPTGSAPPFNSLQGSTTFLDSAQNITDGDLVVSITQNYPVTTASGGAQALSVVRGGDISSHDYAQPAVEINDVVSSITPALQVRKGGALLLNLQTKPTITGALSTVTDAAAQAVLASLIAALTGISAATDGTT